MGTSVPNAPICYFPEDRGYKMTGRFEEKTEAEFFTETVYSFGLVLTVSPIHINFYYHHHHHFDRGRPSSRAIIIVSVNSSRRP